MEMKGKKLLLLGGTNIMSDLCAFRDKTGVQFLTTQDNKYENSPLRTISEKSFSVSPLDKDGLIRLVRKEKIDGLFCGGNENIISCAVDVADACGLPFYCNREQWDNCANKEKFKSACREYGIPVVTEYCVFRHQLEEEKLAAIRYPSIMKPVDSCGSKGVVFCACEEELRKQFDSVMDSSASKTAIVEQYVTGTEIVAYFTLSNGEITLSSVSDRFNPEGESGLNSLPQAYQYPSKYTKLFQEKYAESFIRMFRERFHLLNGILGVQGFACQGKLMFFEMGYRLGGTSQFRYTYANNGINNMEMLIAHSLTGSMDYYPLSLDNAMFSKPCCTLTFRSKPGTIAQILGVEETRKLKGCICLEAHYAEGETVKKTNSLAEMVFWVFLYAEDETKLRELIRKVKGALKVLDSNGEEMLISTFDENRLDYDYI